jgi:hypothetical protein
MKGWVRRCEVSRSQERWLFFGIPLALFLSTLTAQFGRQHQAWSSPCRWVKVLLLVAATIVGVRLLLHVVAKAMRKRSEPRGRKLRRHLLREMWKSRSLLAVLESNRWIQSAILGLAASQAFLVMALLEGDPQVRLIWKLICGILFLYVLAALFFTFRGTSTYETLAACRRILQDHSVDREVRAARFERYQRQRLCRAHYCPAVGVKRAARETGFHDAVVPAIRKRFDGWIWDPRAWRR